MDFFDGDYYDYGAESQDEDDEEEELWEDLGWVFVNDGQCEPCYSCKNDKKMWLLQHGSGVVSCTFCLRKLDLGGIIGLDEIQITSEEYALGLREKKKKDDAAAMELRKKKLNNKSINKLDANMRAAFINNNTHNIEIIDGVVVPFTPAPPPTDEMPSKASGGNIVASKPPQIQPTNETPSKASGGNIIASQPPSITPIISPKPTTDNGTALGAPNLSPKPPEPTPKIGDQVKIKRGKSGVIKFIEELGNIKVDIHVMGNPAYDDHIYGIELDKWSIYGNDGNAVFPAKKGHGYFVKLSHIISCGASVSGEAISSKSTIISNNDGSLHTPHQSPISSATAPKPTKPIPNNDESLPSPHQPTVTPIPAIHKMDINNKKYITQNRINNNKIIILKKSVISPIHNPPTKVTPYVTLPSPTHTPSSIVTAYEMPPNISSESKLILNVLLTLDSFLKVSIISKSILNEPVILDSLLNLLVGPVPSPNIPNQSYSPLYKPNTTHPPPNKLQYTPNTPSNASKQLIIKPIPAINKMDQNVLSNVHNQPTIKPIPAVNKMDQNVISNVHNQPTIKPMPTINKMDQSVIMLIMICTGIYGLLSGASLGLPEGDGLLCGDGLGVTAGDGVAGAELLPGLGDGRLKDDGLSGGGELFNELAIDGLDLGALSVLLCDGMLGYGSLDNGTSQSSGGLLQYGAGDGLSIDLVIYELVFYGDGIDDAVPKDRDKDGLVVVVDGVLKERDKNDMVDTISQFQYSITRHKGGESTLCRGDMHMPANAESLAKVIMFGTCAASGEPLAMQKCESDGLDPRDRDKSKASGEPLAELAIKYEICGTESHIYDIAETISPTNGDPLVYNYNYFIRYLCAVVKTLTCAEQVASLDAIASITEAAINARLYQINNNDILYIRYDFNSHGLDFELDKDEYYSLKRDEYYSSRGN